MDAPSHSYSTLLSPATLTTIASTVGRFYQCDGEKKNIPMRTSPLTGRQYIDELLASQNSERIRQVLRMPQPTFHKLCAWFRNHGYLSTTTTNACGVSISVEEQVAMFIKVVAENASNRTVQERFQHSGNTVSR